MLPNAENQQLQKQSRQVNDGSDDNGDEETDDEENENKENEYEENENEVNDYEEFEDEDVKNDRALQFAKGVLSNLRVLDPEAREIMMKYIMCIIFKYELKNMSSDYGSRRI